MSSGPEVTHLLPEAPRCLRVPSVELNSKQLRRAAVRILAQGLICWRRRVRPAGPCGAAETSRRDDVQYFWQNPPQSVAARTRDAIRAAELSAFDPDGTNSRRPAALAHDTRCQLVKDGQSADQQTLDAAKVSGWGGCTPRVTAKTAAAVQNV